MAGWKPPKFGSPCWLGIAATDVARAHKFYSVVFNWTFKPQPSNLPESELRMFDFNPDVNLSGGLLLVPEESGVLKPGHGGVCVNWLVQDLDKTSESIIAAGGKMLSDKRPEGTSGIYRYFEDTEGNIGSVYQISPGGDQST